MMVDRASCDANLNGEAMATKLMNVFLGILIGALGGGFVGALFAAIANPDLHATTFGGFWVGALGGAFLGALFGVCARTSNCSKTT
jgi:hypothetical protein